MVYWLNYKSLTGLQNLFSEASLVSPIAEYLKTKSIPEIGVEITHPSFKPAVGRPRQVDFVGYDKKQQWRFVIETKYYPVKPQHLVNDICRLLVLDKNRCERYLVIALEK